MKLAVNADRVLSRRNMMLYGMFIEHFHRQVYGGIYDPDSPFADEDGLRTDVMDALRHIGIPVLRWPGGCFVSSYDWKKGVGPVRTPVFDKAWRVEESNAFGTDEYVRMCRKLGCEPYICTNAGTGTAQEMSDWVEYCNLKSEGEYARQRIQNGWREPHAVKYWSIGNENYGGWEIGAKTANEWSRLVTEAAKMMLRADPSIELSVAALPDIDWNVELIKRAGGQLSWISIHEYWDPIHTTNALANYEQCMAYTADLGNQIRQFKGLLTAFGLEKRIKIAFDEWNLRGWYHPNSHTTRPGLTPEEYLLPRDKNDLNESYTMADAVFTACFLNELLRNSDIVGMANYAPCVNTRGLIYTHGGGIVRRATYHVFDLFVNRMGDEVLDAYADSSELWRVKGKDGETDVSLLDIVATRDSASGAVCVSIVNKHASEGRTVEIELQKAVRSAELYSLAGDSCEAYNDVGVNRVEIHTDTVRAPMVNRCEVTVGPHSVNVVRISL